eukprot:3727676-Amphidinium_carterae.1
MAMFCRPQYSRILKQDPFDRLVKEQRLGHEFATVLDFHGHACILFPFQRGFSDAVIRMVLVL